MLGPQLIADTGDGLQQHVVAPVLNRVEFAHAASSALVGVRTQAGGYVAQATSVDYPPETSWLMLLSTAGHEGLGRAMRAYGYGLSASAFFGNAGLAWQT